MKTVASEAELEQMTKSGWVWILPVRLFPFVFACLGPCYGSCPDPYLLLCSFVFSLFLYVLFGYDGMISASFLSRTSWTIVVEVDRLHTLKILLLYC